MQATCSVGWAHEKRTRVEKKNEQTDSWWQKNINEKNENKKEISEWTVCESE